VKAFRNPAFAAAVTMSMVLLLYFGLVADRGVVLLSTDGAAAKAIGTALFVFPAIGLWWMAHEWRLGTTVQRMASILEDEGRLPVHDGETLPSGRLTPEAAEAIFEVARRSVEDRPNDWRAWFHVAYAYEAERDRREARRSLRYAADLFRAERRARRAG
jgi:hypothetical protein